MSTAWRIRCIVLIAVIAMTLLACVEFVYGDVKGTFKIEVTEDRAIISCVDGSNPIMRTAPRPMGGYYAVVVCEKGQ